MTVSSRLVPQTQDVGAANDAHVVDGNDLQPRSASTVAQRLLAMLAVVGRSREEVATQSVSWVKRNGVDAFFSDAERRFYFFGRQPSPHDLTHFSWRAEAIVALVWSLDGMQALPPLDRQVDIWSLPPVQSALRSPRRFTEAARRRPVHEVIEQEALHFDAHSRLREARRRGLPPPDGLNASIVHERRYALTWLLRHGSDWDAVPMDA